MIREAAAEGSSSWTLGEYAVSIRSDLRSTASLPASPTACPDDYFRWIPCQFDSRREVPSVVTAAQAGLAIRASQAERKRVPSNSSVLKEYLLRGLVRDQRIGKLEKRMTAAERSIDTIIYALMPALPENSEPIGSRV